MATSNLGLVQPASSDIVKISDLNGNFGILDEAIGPVKQSGGHYIGIVNMIYPIGSIYMSTGSTDPKNLFPGTKWTQIKNKFLVGTGNYFPIGTNGGQREENFTLTGTVGEHELKIKEMPAHTHSASGISATTASAGGSHSHTVPSHKHSLNSHTHTLSSHTHSISHSHGSSDSSYYIVEEIGGDSDWAVLAKGTSGQSFSTATYSGSSGGPSTNTTGAASGDTGTKAAFSTESTSISHTHSVTISGETGSRGSGEGHTHPFTGTSFTVHTVPPFMPVYMWQRTE